jgi:hypothetical protein
MADSKQQFVKRRPAIVRFAKTRPRTLFFLLAYSWAWIFSLIVPRVIRQTALGPNSDSFDIPVFITAAFVPSVGALITRWLSQRDRKICPLWTGWRGFALPRLQHRYGHV